MKKNIIIVIGLVAAMGLALVLQNVLSVESPIDKHIKQLEIAILAEQWPQVRMILAEIGDEWKRRKVWLSVNNSRRDIQEFTRSLAQLRAYARVEDKPGAFAEAAHLRERWWGFAE